MCAPTQLVLCVFDGRSESAPTTNIMPIPVFINVERKQSKSLAESKRVYERSVVALRPLGVELTSARKKSSFLKKPVEFFSKL